MTYELTILAWVMVLTIVQILLPAMFRNRETGLAYNAGPRDEEGPPVGKITGRLIRARNNLFETLPVFITAVLLVHLSGSHSDLTRLGVTLYIAARIIHIPLYAFGIPYLRSFVWMGSLIGIGLLLAAVL